MGDPLWLCAHTTCIVTGYLAAIDITDDENILSAAQDEFRHARPLATGHFFFLVAVNGLHGYTVQRIACGVEDEYAQLTPPPQWTDGPSK